ncbi:DNA primase [Streptomyces spectabilis]|uniref:DNA primase n=1 Tax=Streptomyces spectabilis TaxID=68270 RepID=A0A516RFY1_STRST|nr:DNA primase [Streptomyces spectabilis]QDQ14567.1 DNA primase [Streptomyces spectabilis]
MNRLAVGLGVGAGYLLGRTKKAKLAFAVGTMVAGRKLKLSPASLARAVSDQLENNPQFKEIGDQLKEDLRGVGKAATGSLLDRRLESFADRLHDRTLDVRDRMEGAVPGVDGADEEPDEPEDAEAADDRGERDEPRDKGRDATRKTRATAKKATRSTGDKSGGSTGSGQARKKSPAPRRTPSARGGQSRDTAKRSAAKRAPAKRSGAQKPSRAKGGDDA